MLNIYKKDLKQYFTTPAGYFYIVCILVIGGLYCYMYNFVYGYSSFEYTVNNLPFFMMFFIPIIASGVFTEEKKQNTEQLLYTLPVRMGSIVIGKYTALLTVMLIPLLIMCAYPLIISHYGNINLAVSYSNIMAVFLLSACLTAVCMFISAICGNQIVAGIISFAVLFGLYKMNSISNSLVGSAKNSFVALVIIAILLFVILLVLTKNIFVSFIPAAVIVIIAKLLYDHNKPLIAGKINVIMDSIAVFTRMNNFMNGIFDYEAVFYYISISVMFVIFTIFTLERRRWI